MVPIQSVKSVTFMMEELGISLKGSFGTKKRHVFINAQASKASNQTSTMPYPVQVRLREVMMVVCLWMGVDGFALAHMPRSTVYTQSSHHVIGVKSRTAPRLQHFVTTFQCSLVQGNDTAMTFGAYSQTSVFGFALSAYCLSVIHFLSGIF